MAADIAALLAIPRPGRFDLWLDVADPATYDVLADVDLDGRRHGGLPFRFDGKTPVRMRHLPTSDAGLDLACGLEAARAWALQQMAGNTLIRMDYDVPWTLAIQLARRAVTAPPGLNDLLAISTREGDWLTDFISDHAGDAAVLEFVAADVGQAADAGITTAPAITVSEYTIPGQTTALHDRVSELLR